MDESLNTSRRRHWRIALVYAVVAIGIELAIEHDPSLAPFRFMAGVLIGLAVGVAAFAWLLGALLRVNRQAAILRTLSAESHESARRALDLQQQTYTALKAANSKYDDLLKQIAPEPGRSVVLHFFRGDAISPWLISIPGMEHEHVWSLDEAGKAPWLRALFDGPVPVAATSQPAEFGRPS